MKPHIFGVRHLSPAAAIHLEALLDKIQPTAVLIEGPADMSALIPEITKGRIKLPIAMMAYTNQLPVATIVYPLSEYSPEYRALVWAAHENVYTEFIDLPSSISISWDRSMKVEEVHSVNIYEEIARISEEYDYETYWERHFEQINTPETFQAAMNQFARELRDLEEHTDTSSERQYHETREFYMRKQIERILDDGHVPGKVVVITGAYHVPALLADKHPKVELDSLLKRETSLTLMPYSNFKISSQSGYGAGNHAPAYFQLLWESFKTGDRERVPAYYLSQIVSYLRDSGTYRSTAEVVEGTRLAHALSSFRSSVPTLKDLRDAATICLGHGEFSIIADACVQVEIGNSIGELPDGVSQTPIQEDFVRRLKKLKLEKYRKPILSPIELDLRENRRVKSKDAAFLDLHRSLFFHQLTVLGIHFALPATFKQENASWAEHWTLRYNPEVEIQLVESTLLGETIELAAAYQLKQRLSECNNIGEAAELVHISYLCGMLEMMEEARKAVADLSIDSADFVANAAAVGELTRIIQYGDVRGLDPKPLIPLVERLFLRGTLLLVDAAACNNERAKEVMRAIQEMNETAQLLFEHVDEKEWFDTLTELYLRDDRNPLLSGYSCGILLEKNKINAADLEEEVARRLSPGMPADLGSSWFEGLSMSNKYALISRSYLWEKMDLYISTLTDDQFRRALVFLRRSFSNFSSSDRSKVAELLGGIWGMDELSVSEYLNDTLTETEEIILDELNEFDFGDF